MELIIVGILVLMWSYLCLWIGRSSNRISYYEIAIKEIAENRTGIFCKPSVMFAKSALKLERKPDERD